MIAANVAFALTVAVAVVLLFLFGGFTYLECLTAYSVCGAFSMLAFSWASATRPSLRADHA